jgi:hypothetical protein
MSLTEVSSSPVDERIGLCENFHNFIRFCSLIPVLCENGDERG